MWEKAGKSLMNLNEIGCDLMKDWLLLMMDGQAKRLKGAKARRTVGKTRQGVENLFDSDVTMDFVHTTQCVFPATGIGHKGLAMI